MKIRMLKTTKVSTTGLNCLTWGKDHVCDAPEDLARALVRAELAEQVKSEPEKKPEPKPKLAVRRPKTEK